MICFYTESSQGSVERRKELDKLRDQIELEESSLSSAEQVTAEARQDSGARRVLELLASGVVESVCLKDPQIMARTEGELDALGRFLDEKGLGLVVGSGDDHDVVDRPAVDDGRDREDGDRCRGDD